MAAAAVVAALVLAPADNGRTATIHAGQPVMGTVLQVTICAENEVVARKLAEASIATARHWEDVLTTWRPDGELALLNSRAGRGFFAISRDLVTSLLRMQQLSDATSGAFDPAVGPFVERLRNRTETVALDPLSERFKIGRALTLNRADEAKLIAGARLDPGGIGKGIALDAIAAELHRAGAHAAFLDFGGSSQLAFGVPEQGGRWTMLLAGAEPGQVLGTLVLADRSLATSRASRAEDAAGAIVDPRTGTAVPTPRMVTVIADDATTADAWSTALVVLGPAGLAIAIAAGIEGLICDESGIHKTPGFPLEPISTD